MLNRIIRIAAVACTLSILAGCTARLDSAEEGVISFSAGSPLLRDDATKGTLKEGTTFTTDDAFLVWAWHDAANQHLSFGTSTPVTFNGTTWDYAPHQYWNWREGEDFYDFLAFFPAGKTISHSAATTQNKLLRAALTYNATADQFDFMAAGQRRTDKSTGIVNLTFQHMLCAVSVKVTNSKDSKNAGGYPLTVTLRSCKFGNLISSASIDVTFDGASLISNLTGSRPEPGTPPVLGPVIPNNTTLPAQDPQVYYPTTPQWDLMVPQNLNPDEGLSPTLVIVYNKGDANDVEESVDLKTIKNKVSGVPITEWRAGYKYEYEIELQIGVGIMVKVTTTPWETVEAETPGLMI